MIATIANPLGRIGIGFVVLLLLVVVVLGVFGRNP